MPPRRPPPRKIPLPPRGRGTPTGPPGRGTPVARPAARTAPVRRGVPPIRTGPPPPTARVPPRRAPVRAPVPIPTPTTTQPAAAPTIPPPTTAVAQPTPPPETMQQRTEQAFSQKGALREFKKLKRQVQKSATKVPKSVNPQAQWTKWAAPKDPMTLEEGTNAIGPSPAKFKMELKNKIQTRLRNTSSSKEQTAYFEMLAKLDEDRFKNEINDEYVQDFNKWLQGKSPNNVTGYTKVASTANQNPLGSRRGLAGVSAEDIARKRTPWGNKNLFQVEGVKEYLAGAIDNRMEFILKLTRLKLNGPQNVNEAYLYYKYIVRQEGIKFNTIEFLRDFEMFDWDPTPPTRYHYSDVEQSRPIQPLSLANPAPPPLDPGYYEGAFNAYSDLVEHAPPPPLDPGTGQPLYNQSTAAAVTDAIADDAWVVLSTEQQDDFLIATKNLWEQQYEVLLQQAQGLGGATQAEQERAQKILNRIDPKFASPEAPVFPTEIAGMQGLQQGMQQGIQGLGQGLGGIGGNLGTIQQGITGLQQGVTGELGTIQQGITGLQQGIVGLNAAVQGLQLMQAAGAPPPGLGGLPPPPGSGAGAQPGSGGITQPPITATSTPLVIPTPIPTITPTVIPTTTTPVVVPPPPPQPQPQPLATGLGTTTTPAPTVTPTVVTTGTGTQGPAPPLPTGQPGTATGTTITNIPPVIAPGTPVKTKGTTKVSSIQLGTIPATAQATQPIQTPRQFIGTTTTFDFRNLALASTAPQSLKDLAASTVKIEDPNTVAATKVDFDATLEDAKILASDLPNAQETTKLQTIGLKLHQFLVSMKGPKPVIDAWNKIYGGKAKGREVLEAIGFPANTFSGDSNLENLYSFALQKSIPNWNWEELWKDYTGYLSDRILNYPAVDISQPGDLEKYDPQAGVLDFSEWIRENMFTSLGKMADPRSDRPFDETFIGKYTDTRTSTDRKPNPPFALAEMIYDHMIPASWPINQGSGTNVSQITKLADTALNQVRGKKGSLPKKATLENILNPIVNSMSFTPHQLTESNAAFDTTRNWTNLDILTGVDDELKGAIEQELVATFGSTRYKTPTNIATKLLTDYFLWNQYRNDRTPLASSMVQKIVGGPYLQENVKIPISFPEFTARKVVERAMTGLGRTLPKNLPPPGYNYSTPLKPPTKSRLQQNPTLIPLGTNP